MIGSIEVTFGNYDRYKAHQSICAYLSASRTEKKYLWSKLNDTIIFRQEAVSDDQLSQETYQFCVDLSPMKRNKGKASFITLPDDLEKWVHNLFSKNGLDIVGEVSYVALPDNIINNNKKITNGHRFTGMCKIADKQNALKALNFGIGRQRSYGFGLLFLQS